MRVIGFAVCVSFVHGTPVQMVGDKENSVGLILFRWIRDDERS
jgi:hypothetical protein